MGSDKILHEHTVIDQETGEVIRNSYYERSQNGKDWWIMYRITMAFIASGQLKYAAVRVYMHIAAFADWRGVLPATRSAIARELHLSPTAVSDAINSLKKFDLIRETKERGVPVFYINPTYATLGKNKTKRLEIFNQLPHADDIIEINTCEQLASTF